jgi:hypothetical protein
MRDYSSNNIPDEAVLASLNGSKVLHIASFYLTAVRFMIDSSHEQSLVGSGISILTGQGRSVIPRIKRFAIP